MSIEDEIKRIGGFTPVTGNANLPPSSDDISAAVKAYGRALPQDYLNFIEKHGFSGPTKIVLVSFPKNLPVYSPDESETGIPPNVQTGCGLSYFYGGEPAEGRHESLGWNVDCYDGRMPEGFLPIADDGFGNQICLGHSQNGVPGIYFWDHNDEWDAEDYREDYGTDMPEIMKYQNVFYIADSLEGLFKRIVLEQCI